MNWYIEQNGVSQGPFTEQALTQQLQAKPVPADTLVWHVGLDDWQPIAKLRPDWPTSAPARTMTASPTVAAKDTVAPAAKAAEAPKAAKTAKAGVAAEPEVAKPEAETPAEKPGLFKKIFGGSKKK
jgi:hypothetical protein